MEGKRSFYSRLEKEIRPVPFVVARVTRHTSVSVFRYLMVTHSHRSSSFAVIAILLVLVSCSLGDYGGKNIVVYGDSRPNDERHVDIIDAILKVFPDVVFHTGDLVNEGHKPGLWTRFNIVTRELREVADFYPAAGNHERESVYYYDNFVLPNNEKWYSVDVDGVYFFVLNTNLDVSPGSEQHAWLTAELAATVDTSKFTVAIFHHPLICTGPHEPKDELRGSLMPLFETYGVDIVFSGHNHLYERSFLNGIYYVVTGGGGAPLYNVHNTSANPYSQVLAISFHFCLLNLNGTALAVEVFDVNMDLIDSFRVDS